MGKREDQNIRDDGCYCHHFCRSNTGVGCFSIYDELKVLEELFLIMEFVWENVILGI